MNLRKIIARRGTKISYTAILHNVQYDKTSVIRGLVKMERASIGKCTSIGTLSAAYDCKIGNFSSIARDCYIGGASHPLNWVSTSNCFYLEENFTGVCYNVADFHWHSHTEIGNDCWLGARVIVKSGVTIGDGAVIGAGSVVTKNVGPYEIWAGNPARLIRKRFDDIIIDKLLKSQWWTWDDDKLSRLGKNFMNIDDFVRVLEKDLRYGDIKK